MFEPHLRASPDPEVSLQREAVDVTRAPRSVCRNWESSRTHIVKGLGLAGIHYAASQPETKSSGIHLRFDVVTLPQRYTLARASTVSHVGAVVLRITLPTGSARSSLDLGIGISCKRGERARSKVSAFIK